MLFRSRYQGASALNSMIRQVVPFYGAYLQAERVALRTLSGKGLTPTQRGEAYRTLAMTSSQLMVLGMLYAALASDDDEFKDMTSEERDHKLVIPGAHMTIPMRRDWTLLPHVVGIHVYNQLFNKSFRSEEHTSEL